MIRNKSRSIRDLEMAGKGEYIHMDPYEEVKHQPGPSISHLKFRWLQIAYWKVILYYICCLLSAGILPVIALNYPGLQRWLTSSECLPSAADFVEIQDTEETSIEINYGNVEHSICGGVHYACFESLGRRYFALSSKNFEVCLAPDAPANFSDRFVVGDSNYSRPDRNQIIALFGLNTMQLQAADPFEVIISEVMSPFYLFQYFAIAVWLYTDYIAYSVIVMFITIVSITFVCRDKLFNLKRLHDLAGYESHVTRIIPSTGTTETIGTSQLAPGDCYEVTNNMEFPCDSILIKGRVVVDESMLTGESVPVTKTEFIKSPTDIDATKRTANILYSGTKVKVVPTNNEKVIAMAYKTGFRSARGQCVAALITPKTEIVSFLPDALMAIFFMVIITTAIFGWSADQLKSLDTADKDIVIAYLTALTIAVPPGLVACLSIATSISVVRLSKSDVSITDTTKLNAAGYCSFACFDKTGTLTDENIVYQGMKVYGINPSNMTLEHIVREIMASCHSLSIVDGIPDGDPLEVELLRASEWKLSLSSGKKHAEVTPPQSSPNGGKPHQICRHFEFSPEKLRAGTILHRPTGEFVFLVKGSPEMILNLSIPNTIPSNVDQDITLLTKKGFRVLAVGYRICNESEDWLTKTANQDDLEKDIIFLGLVYFTNKLKDDTYPRTIQSLRDANIMVTMITGDHYQTAIAISTECRILSANRILYVIHDPDPLSDTPHLPSIFNGDTDEEINITFEQLIEKYYDTNRLDRPSDVVPLQIVMTGVGLIALNKHSPHLIEPLARITNTFARMKPGDKKTIVKILQQPNSHTGTGHENHVVFCGDGANDMEALSAATVGISLCDTATTVAAAVVSTKQTPLAVVEVLKEGRCSLVTAYVLVCYNIMYAIIQLFMTCYLNNMGLVFGDNMYIVQDLFFSLFLGLCISDLGPDDHLSTRLPPKSLFSPGLMIKLLLQLGIFPAFQAITLEILKTQDWYTPYETDDPLNDSWAVEGSVVNIIALSQLMIAAVVVTIGKPFRKPWYTSKYLLFVLALQTAYIFYLLFGETNAFMRGVTNKHVPRRFAGILLAIIAGNIGVSAIATKFADLFF